MVVESKPSLLITVFHLIATSEMTRLVIFYDVKYKFVLIFA